MKSANIKIITNNPMAVDKYTDLTLFEDCPIIRIFTLARDEIHLGAKLINHPLSGSIKPNESPYKSLVLSTKREKLDCRSLEIIEAAFETLAKLTVRYRELPERVMSDFQVIDLDLLDSAIGALPAEYYI